jgi:hypothetical protein
VLSPQKDHHGITYPLGIIKEKEQKEACDCVLHNLAVMQSVSNMTFQHPSPVGLSSVLNITGPQPLALMLLGTVVLQLPGICFGS